MNENEICPQEVDCVDKDQLPSVMQMAKNLMSDSSKILNNAIKGNGTLVDENIREERWRICQSCPRLQNDRCLECGCFMKVKVAFVTSKCPLEKW